MNGAQAHLQQPVRRHPDHGAGPGRRGHTGRRRAEPAGPVPPALDFTALAAGQGVPAARATTAAEFAAQLRRALAEPGPHLIEAVPP